MIGVDLANHSRALLPSKVCRVLDSNDDRVGAARMSGFASPAERTVRASSCASVSEAGSLLDGVARCDSTIRLNTRFRTQKLVGSKV